MLGKFDLPKPGVSKVFPILADVPKTIKLNCPVLTKQTRRVVQHSTGCGPEQNGAITNMLYRNSRLNYLTNYLVMIFLRSL